MPPYCLWPLIDEVLAGTEKLWRQEYGCPYLWPESRVKELIDTAKKKPRFWNEDATLEDFFENDSVYLCCSPEEVEQGEEAAEEETELQRAAKKKTESFAKFIIDQKPSDFKCPFDLRVGEVIRDRDFFEFFDGYGFVDLGFDVSTWMLAEKLYEKWLFLQCQNPSKQLETTFLIDVAMRAHMCHPIVRGQHRKFPCFSS